jgi:hypothetical protein
MEQKIEDLCDPDSKTQFVIIPGRYYAAMFFVRLPTTPGDPQLNLGGDVNGLVWRKDETPEEWTIQYRFRYYRSRDAWQSGDDKVWYGGTVNGSEEQVVGAFEQVMQVLSVASGFPVQRLVIQGDSEKFFKVVKNERPSWLHMGIPDEEANKGGNPKTN